MLPIVPPPASIFSASSASLATANPASPVASFASSFASSFAPSLLPNAASAGLSVPLQASLQAPAASAASSPFGDLLVEAVGQVEQLEKQAQTSVEGLISGRGVDVHQAMIAVQKAGMGFELALAVRNKALAAYQQVMGMQF